MSLLGIAEAAIHQPQDASQDHANPSCKWQANNRGKAGDWNHPLITGDYIDRREAWRRLKRFVGPQYLVEPPSIEGIFEQSRILI